MSKVRDPIVYLRGMAEEQRELIRLFETSGYPVELVRELDEVWKYIEGRSISFVIVDASAGESETAARLVELADCSQLYKHPLVLIGEKVSTKADSLTRVYQKILLVDFPYRIAEVLSLISNSFSLVKREPLEGQVDPPSYRNRIIEKKDPSQLISTYGGVMFSSARSKEKFDDELLIPKHNKRVALKQVLHQLDEVNPELALRARRVTYVSSAIANSLALGPSRDANIRTVALVFNQGISEQRELVGVDALREKHTSSCVRKLAEGIRQSAQFAESGLEDSLASRTLQIMANLLLREDVNGNQQLLEDAQCTLAVELSDRACWEGRSWVKGGAYRATKAFSSETSIFSSENVVSNVAKMLAEAVSVRNEEHVSQDLIRDVAQKETPADRAVVEAERLFGFDGHNSVDIFSLEPGMRLARPIIALDGGLVIPANVTLDKDLIWRIWQVAAIRPIKNPVSITAVSHP